MMKVPIPDNSVGSRRLLVTHVVRLITRQAIVAGACLLSLSFATAAELIGTVRSGGKPAPGITVTLVAGPPPATGPTREATTDKSGRYVFSGLVPGEYKVSCGGKELSIKVDYANSRLDCDR